MKNEFFDFLKNNLKDIIPEAAKSALRPYVYGLFFPVKNAGIETSCPKSALSKLSVKKQGKPLASIIIPAHNHFHDTMRCIYSVIKNSTGVPYEVILADDASTDGTMGIGEKVKGLKVARTKKNLGFLMNVNNAAKLARGRYIILLNNDTFVQAGWLDALVSLAEKDGKTGIAGSKLVYKDGRLQEAGGTVNSGGSAANTGKFRDASLPEYNYVRDTDYVSGAAMLVRRDLWKKAGGFDKRFAPAYYEDTDLCFQARKHGYRVLYQPASVVVHFEGLSHGTDTTKGMKRYQEINREKFAKKWGRVLRLPRAEKTAGTVLFIDRSLPEYDRDAGGRMVLHHMKFFAGCGYSVKFMPDNFHATEPYTAELQQAGVEVLHGARYRSNWKKWIMQNRESIALVYLNRPNIAARYIDFIKKKAGLKVLYQGHDIYYVREGRRAEVTGQGSGRAAFWKHTEEAIIKAADISYFPSVADVARIKKDMPGARAAYAPLYIYDTFPRVKFDPKKRKGLLFVGGFGHAPNADAVKWLCTEIMPLIRKEVPGITLDIAGSNPPPDVMALAGNGVRILGYVPENELLSLYARRMLAVVPLRFGSGMKGKIVEAMHYGLPVVTTGTGAEGLDRRMLMVTDDAEGIAGMVVENYGSLKLKAMSKRAADFVKREFSASAMGRAMKHAGVKLGGEK